MALTAMLLGLSTQHVYTGMVGPDSNFLPGSTMNFEIATAKIAACKNVDKKLILGCVINDLFKYESGDDISENDSATVLGWLEWNDDVEVIQNALQNILHQERREEYTALGYQAQ